MYPTIHFVVKSHYIQAVKISKMGQLFQDML